MNTLLNDLIKNKKYEEATYVLETSLLKDEYNYINRINLAKLYIHLKEVNFRAKARSHLEKIIIQQQMTEEVKREVVKLLLNHIYFSIGPEEEALKLYHSHHEYIEEKYQIIIKNKINQEKQLKEKKSPQRGRSVLPHSVAELSNLKSMLNLIFLDYRYRVENEKIGEKFFAIGSCFAGNVAREMIKRKYDVNSIFVGEEINTTFSNLNLVKYIFNVQVNDLKYYKKILEQFDVEKIKNQITNCDNLIYTLGVAPAFFDMKNNFIPHSKENLKELIRNKEVEYRFSTVDENVVQMRELLLLLQEKTKIKKIFLTVSPVPMQVSLLSNSVAVDDSESKSILRSAAGVCSRLYSDNIIYFPSYEMFRWAPCFQNESAFGADDDNIRHVNGERVSVVVEQFISHISK